MAAPKNKRPIDREMQLQEVLAGWNECLNQTEIAEKIGVSRQQVAYDLKVLFQRFREDNLTKITENKLAELAKLDHLETTAWEAWERSCQDATKEVVESGAIAKSKTNITERVTNTREGQCGDPRFLDIIRKCIEDRRKIFGLDAPIKSDIGLSTPSEVADLIAKGLGFEKPQTNAAAA